MKVKTIRDSRVSCPEYIHIVEREDGSCIVEVNRDVLAAIKISSVLSGIPEVSKLLDSLADGDNEYGHDEMHDLADSLVRLKNKPLTTLPT